MVERGSDRRQTIDDLYLSPHLDDAALSCGGTIHQNATAGRRIVVVTVCAGKPGEEALSTYALELHARWSASVDDALVAAVGMVERRRREDRAALRFLGAETVHIDVPDAIYRRDPDTGEWLYADEPSLFGTLSAHEDPLADQLAHRLSSIAGVCSHTRIFVPLGVGSHVDHQLVRYAAERWCVHRHRLTYFEDYPYAEDEDAVRQTTGAPQNGSWRTSLVTLSETDLTAKVRAIAVYRSQISTFWADRAAMVESVRTYANRRGDESGPAERFWRLRGT